VHADSAIQRRRRVHDTTAHRARDLRDRTDVGDGISVDDKQVCCLTDCDRSDLVLRPHRARCIERGHPEYVARRDPRAHEQRELVMRHHAAERLTAARDTP
jgi:hypothetical protein